jgi:hypothetical protein
MQTPVLAPVLTSPIKSQIARRSSADGYFGGSDPEYLLDRACGYTVLILVYAASLPSLLNILTDPWQRGVLMAVLGAGLLGPAALFFLDHLLRR